jgi:hypothetical protein
MRVGTLVVLVGSDGFMPPIGSVGIIVSEFDQDGDCDVFFADCPCPVPPSSSWVAHRSWLIPLPPAAEECKPIFAEVGR